MLLKTHLDIISRNEPIQRKARFWSSYMRALKGTDDMRAPEQSRRTPRSVFRPLFSDYSNVSSKLDSWPYTKSIYDEPNYAADRISSPGYRYQPISRDTYGYSPRTRATDTYRPVEYEPWSKNKSQDYKDNDNAWHAHSQRMADIESKYPKYNSDWELKYPSPSTYRPNIYRPESRIPYALHRSSPPPPRPSYSWKSMPTASEPDTGKTIGFTYSGLPIYSPTGGLSKLAMYDLLNPSPNSPMSSIVRDPWWWKYPELRPFETPYTWRHSPSFLRNSYLSPIKSTYLWTHHPIRPF